MLRAGWNRVLIKVSAQAGMWGFFMRLSDPLGAPIPGLRTSAEAPEDWRPSAGTAAGPRAQAASLRAALEKRFPESARARDAKTHGQRLGDFYRYTHPFDKEDHTPVSLALRVEREAPSAQAHWLRALVERDPGESLQALRRGIVAARTEGASSRPLLARMLLELAWRQRSMRRASS